MIKVSSSLKIIFKINKALIHKFQLKKNNKFNSREIINSIKLLDNLKKFRVKPNVLIIIIIKIIKANKINKILKIDDTKIKEIINLIRDNKHILLNNNNNIIVNLKSKSKLDIINPNIFSN